MPSPMKPTVFPPRSRSTFTMRAFCNGESLANNPVCSARSASSSSLSMSISAPVSMFRALMPTCSHTVAATAALSPVRTLTVTPRPESSSTAALALDLGGSRNAR